MASKPKAAFVPSVDVGWATVHLYPDKVVVTAHLHGYGQQTTVETSHDGGMVSIQRVKG